MSHLDRKTLAEWSRQKAAEGMTLNQQVAALKLSDDSQLCKLRKDPRYIVFEGEVYRRVSRETGDSYSHNVFHAP
jgi:hypothetical protein